MSTPIGSSSGGFASRTTMAVMSLVTEAMGVTSSARLCIDRRRRPRVENERVGRREPELARSRAGAPRAADRSPQGETQRKQGLSSESSCGVSRSQRPYRMADGTRQSPRWFNDLTVAGLWQHRQQCRRGRQRVRRLTVPPVTAPRLQRLGAASSPRATPRRAALFVLLQPPHPRVGAVGGQQLACVPRSTMRPCSSTRIWSASTTVDRRCAIISVVRSRAMLRSSAWIAFSDLESSAEVASSKISIAGFLRIARAIATRCFSPPDSFKPALAHHACRSPGQALDEIVDMREPRRGDDLLARRARAAIRDVVIDACR